MGKFRSKLKRNNKGKIWAKGQSSTSNPEQMKHRLKAQSRFFQPNLSLAPQDPEEEPSTLTMEAIFKHDQRQLCENGNADPTISELAGGLDSCSINEDEMMSETQTGTFKTFKSFASNYSTCTNMSFKKLLAGFRPSSELHKEMLAILTALTEIIKERNGTGTSTEYFILLMETIEASTEDAEIIAGISLLSMGIKSVPVPVLRRRFSKTGPTLLNNLKKYAEKDNFLIMKCIIGCLSVLLRALEYMTWTYSSTWQYIDAILSFTIHSKPKLRKAAQHAIASIIQGSYFMLPPKTNGESHLDKAPESLNQNKYHPAGNRVVRFCLNQFNPKVLTSSQTTVLHTLTLLKDTLACFKAEDIRTICENLLSIMTTANVLVRTNCFHVFHTLFTSRTENLSGSLCGNLLAAIYEYRPDRTDIRQTLAWITVLKEGHIHLAALELKLCINSLPRLFDICTSDLWLSDRLELITGVSNIIKEVLQDCVTMACATQELADQYRSPISKIIACVNRALSAPFGEATKYVVLANSILFQTCGTFFSNELKSSLIALAARYGTESSLRIHIEHSIISAIKAMGPEFVLRCIPLTNSKAEFIVEKSWLLPLLREGITGATFKFFKEVILPLSLTCNTKWKQYAEEKNLNSSHIYELLCCQLWGLLPGFCRNPKDPENFRLLAPTLGNALETNPEFRAPILDGLSELITSENIQIQKIMANYSKNFLPRLFNVYALKPNTTYEADLRKKVLEVIESYVPITPAPILNELFVSAKTQLNATKAGSFENDAMLDIIANILTHQPSEHIKDFLDAFIIPVLKNETSKIVAKDEQKLKKQQRKTYELLRDILSSDTPQCKQFCKKNAVSLQKLLLDAYATSCSVCQAARLKCFKILIENRKNPSTNDKIIVNTIPEAIVSYKEFSTKKENVSEEIIKIVGNFFQESGKLNEFIDILMAGFAGDETIITNTILAFRAVLQNQGKHMSVKTVEFILGQVLVFLVQKSRHQAEASVAFLITLIKIMPTPVVTKHLESIMKSLSAMMPDTKRYCRIQIGYLLKKLCKRFSTNELVKLVPGDDEVTHRRLKKIRKQMRREVRQKHEENKSNDEDESEEEFIPGLEKKSLTIQDFLEDSDSDLPEEMDLDEDKDRKKTKNKSKKQQEIYIREDPEDIVDLADLKSIGNVLTNKPVISTAKLAGNKKKTDKNRGFKTAEDGRLIITDKGADIDSDDDDNDSDDNDETSGKVAKRGLEDDSSDEAEPVAGPSRKRKAVESASMKSGRTTASRYTAGGKGIHRPVAASVKSGRTGYSVQTSGSVYSSKKAQGDMKKKGQVDPYAYIPLDRNTLNKRKRAKLTGTFKSVVKGARKGALRGTKSKIQKRYKK